jgi:hypothetical protein
MGMTFLNVIADLVEHPAEEEKEQTPRFQDVSFDEERLHNILELHLLEREVEIEMIEAKNVAELDSQFF